MPAGLERYGFKSNPFRLALDPLADPTHSDWIIPVDGFTELGEIDDFIAGTANQQAPLIFLVTGRSGTGRTCVANYLLARYRDHRDIDPTRFIIPELVPEQRKVPHHDEYTTFKNWLILLINELAELSPVVELPAELLTTIVAADRDTMQAVFQGVLRRISNRVGAAIPLAGFGCCLEDIPTYKFISAASSIFARTQTICVFTAGDYEEWQKEVIRPFKSAMQGHPVVELTPLIGEQVDFIVNEIWQKASLVENPDNSDQHANPFDREGVRVAFGNKPRPIGKVLSIVARMLELKAPTYESGPSWPEANHLRFSAEELREKLKLLEESEQPVDG